MKTSALKVFCIATLFSACFIGACNNDDDGPGGVNCATFNWATEVESELTVLFDAALSYGTDPTTANCQRYKDAFSDYIDALEGLDNCVAGLSAADRKDYNDALDDAEEELNNLQC